MTSLQAETNNPAIEEIEIVAGRLASPQTGAVTLLSSQIEMSATSRLDDLISSVPGVHLFRRANSLTAHPTIQGLSIRAVGANGAGRALVTLDGVPMNDPFGGWVYWAGIDQNSLSRVDIKRGGAGGAFGSYALAGNIALHSKASGDFTRMSVSFGSHDAKQLSASTSISAGEDDNVTRLTGGINLFETDGDYLFAARDRGPIDAKAASKSTSGHVGLSHEFNSNTSAHAQVRYFNEDRINGYEAAPNSTEAVDYTARIAHQGDVWGAELISYYKTRDFANVFASAREERTVGRQVLDQYDVPAWGAGSSLRITHGDMIEMGIDFRRMSGEVNENYKNLGGGFLGNRHAGGDQKIFGAFINHAWQFDRLRADASLRIDQYDVYGGVRQETVIATGDVSRREDYDDVNGTLPTASASVTYEINDNWSYVGGVSKSWRLPTLNEYYRPFRVVNDITEANAALTPEKLYTLEAGFKGKIDNFDLSLNIYRAYLKDGVGNVTIGFGPGFYPLGGYVPGGGVLRQRDNIDESITDGLELDLSWAEGPWNLRAGYLYADARVTEFAANKGVVGNKPVQTPKHTLNVSAAYAAETWWVSSEMRYSSNQFDDDLNARALGDVFKVNAGMGYDLNDNASIRFDAENIFNATVISALSSTGLETLAVGREWRISLQANF